MNKPKILYIHGGGEVIGGIETFIARSLKYHACESYLGVVRYGRFFEYMRNTGFGNLIDLEGGRLRQIPKTFKAVYNAVKFIKNHDIKLVISHGAHSWVFGGAISKLCGVKSIYYVQGEVKKEDFRNVICGTGFRIKPTLYVANSEFTAKSVRRYLKGEVVVNHLASDIAEFDSVDGVEARRKLREQFNIPQGKFIFSVTGRIQHWKGQDTAVLAFKNMRHKDRAVLLVVGDCSFGKDGAFHSYLREISRDESSVIFTGFRPDIPFIMKGSDAIIHTSRVPEPFGIVVVEGMMSRKPVIASSHGGPLEIIESGKNGFLFKPGGYGELAELMDKLVEDEHLREKISEEAYKKAKAEYSMEVSVGRLEEVISGVVGR